MADLNPADLTVADLITAEELADNGDVSRLQELTDFIIENRGSVPPEVAEYLDSIISASTRP